MDFRKFDKKRNNKTRNDNKNHLFFFSFESDFECKLVVHKTIIYQFLMDAYIFRPQRDVFNEFGNWMKDEKARFH